MTAPSFMDLALKAAENAGKSGEVPIGCVIVRGKRGRRIGGKPDPDRPRSHCPCRDPGAPGPPQNHRQRTTDGLRSLCDVGTLHDVRGRRSRSRIRQILLRRRRPKGGAVESGVQFFAAPTCHHRPEVYPSVGENQAATLLRGFLKARR